MTLSPVLTFDTLDLSPTTPANLSVMDGRSPGHITYVPDLLQGRRTWGKI